MEELLRCSHSLDRRMLEFSGSFTMASWARLRNPAGESFIGDTVGGITIDWSDGRWINLTLALQDTLKVMEGDFPEITR